MSESAQVALVCMPFHDVDTPSLALGLLKALAAKHSIPVKVHYLNLLLAQMERDAHQLIVTTSLLGGE